MEALSKQLANMGIDVSRDIINRTKITLRNNILNNLKDDLNAVKSALLITYFPLLEILKIHNIKTFNHITESLYHSGSTKFAINWATQKWKTDTKIIFNVNKSIIGNNAHHKVTINMLNLQNIDDATFEYTRNDSGEATVFTYKKNKPKSLLVAIALYQLFYNDIDTRMHKPPINIILKSGKSVDKTFTAFKDFLFYVGEIIYKDMSMLLSLEEDSNEKGCKGKGCTVMGGKKKAPKVK